jgi:Uma2 family endonuclease
VKPASRSAKLTYEDFVTFPDDGKRHEIIDGEHYVTPSTNRKHQAIVQRLTAAISSFLETHPLGEVYPAPFDVLLSSTDVVEPDLVYVSRERRHMLTDAHVKGSPDLVIEILSPTTRRVDQTAKRDLYARSDVREYWVVDPDTETVAIFRRGASGGFEAPVRLTQAARDLITTPLLPDLSIALARLFAAVM